MILLKYCRLVIFKFLNWIHFKSLNMVSMYVCIVSEYNKLTMLLTSSNHPLYCVFSFRVFLLLLDAAAD